MHKAHTTSLCEIRLSNSSSRCFVAPVKCRYTSPKITSLSYGMLSNTKLHFGQLIFRLIIYVA